MRTDTDNNFKQVLVDWLIAQLVEEPERAKNVFEAILKLELWKSASSKLRETVKPTKLVTLMFQSHWMTSAHLIREQILCDKDTVNLLYHMMPRYRGEDKVLYRGESKWNWDNGQIGFCWSEKQDVAKMFAAGLHNGEFGAVIIRGTFPAGTIIAGVEPEQTHTLRDREREFTIDPFCDVLVEAIECHGPYDETGNYKPDWPLPNPVTRRCQP